MAQNTNQIDPATIKALLETSGDDVEMMALLKQMHAADQLRGTALSRQSKTPWGALAQGLAGYGAGQQDKQFMEQMKGYGGRRKTSRGALYDAMFPGQTPEQGPEQVGGPGMPGMPEELIPPIGETVY